jgi:nicotinamidase-related amidase
MKLAQAVLLIIDVQKAIDAGYHAADGPRNNLDAEAKIARLLVYWRRHGWPIVHIRDRYGRGDCGKLKTTCARLDAGRVCARAPLCEAVL